MLKMKKVCAMLSILMACMLVISACTIQGNTNTETTTKSTPGTTAPTTTASQEPTKLRLFMSTLGRAVPEEVDPTDNPFLDVIEELANVEFTEVIVPPYADYDQKFQLTVASGDMPDVMHDQWDPEGMNKFGLDGAFEPLNSYIEKSEYLNEFFTKDHIEMMKATDGNVYRLSSKASGDIEAFEYRKDLVDELNGGVVPTTPEGWYDVAKKLKEKYPESVPFSGIQGVPSSWLYRAFGLDSNKNIQWQYTNGKYIHIFEAPLMKDCLQFLKKCYDEGLLDRNFITNTVADYGNVRFYNNMLCREATYQNAVSDMQKVSDENLPCVFSPGVQPVTEDTRVDPNNVYYSTGLLGASSLLIASTSKEKDAAFHLIETFCKPEVLDLAAWGREGVEYNVVNGKNVLNVEKSIETSYRWMYGIMRYYNYPDQINITREHILSRFPDTKDELTKNYDDGWAQIEAKAKTIPLVLPKDLTKLESETSAKMKEGVEAGKSIISKFITGEITMDEYDKETAAFLEKYKGVTEEYNTKTEQMKSKWGF